MVRVETLSTLVAYLLLFSQATSLLLVDASADISDPFQGVISQLVDCNDELSQAITKFLDRVKIGEPSRELAREALRIYHGREGSVHKTKLSPTDNNGAESPSNKRVIKDLILMLLNMPSGGRSESEITLIESKTSRCNNKNRKRCNCRCCEVKCRKKDCPDQCPTIKPCPKCQACPETTTTTSTTRRPRTTTTKSRTTTTKSRSTTTRSRTTTSTTKKAKTTTRRITTTLEPQTTPSFETTESPYWSESSIDGPKEEIKKTKITKRGLQTFNSRSDWGSYLTGVELFEELLTFTVDSEELFEILQRLFELLPDEISDEEDEDLQMKILHLLGEDLSGLDERHLPKSKELIMSIVGHLMYLKEGSSTRPSCLLFCFFECKKTNCSNCPDTCSDDDCPEPPTCPKCPCGEIQPKIRFRQCKGQTCKWSEICGRAPMNQLSSSSNRLPYIVNGEDQMYGEWPQFARILTVVFGIPSLCGGVLISPRHVLTAAHCVTFLDDEIMRHDDIEVILGEHFTLAKDIHERKLNVKRVCRAKKYSTLNELGTADNDYAILELEQDVTFNDHIQPACLPWKSDFKTRGSSSRCFVVGMGTSSWISKDQPIFPKIIQKMRVEQVSCGRWDILSSDKSRICYTKANSEPGDSCSGDSGGPILCLDAQRRWQVAGLVSYGTTRCDGAEPFGWVGVYTRVDGLLDDIVDDCKLSW